MVRLVYGSSHPHSRYAFGWNHDYLGGAITELKIIACLGGAFCISWQLTLACLTLAPVVGFLMVWLNRKCVVPRWYSCSSTWFHRDEALNNVLTVQAYTMEA